MSSKVPAATKHVFARVMLNGQELETSLNMAATSPPPAPPPAPPPPPPLPASTLALESPTPAEHRASIVRFNSQPEYFPDYDSLQGSGNWSGGSPRSLEGLAPPQAPRGSPPPPPQSSPPPPPDMVKENHNNVHPPPVPPQQNGLTRHPVTFTSQVTDQSGEVIYSTVDRAKKRISQGTTVTVNGPTTTSIPSQPSPALEQSLTPNTMPFSPHDTRGQSPQKFNFQGLSGDNTTPMLNNGAPLVNIHTATALVDNLSNSLNTINYRLFDKNSTAKVPATTSAASSDGVHISMVTFSPSTNTSQHVPNQQIFTTSTPPDLTYPTYATIPPRQSSFISAPVTGNPVHPAYSSLDRQGNMVDSRGKLYSQDSYNLSDLYRGRISSKSANTKANPLYSDNHHHHRLQDPLYEGIGPHAPHQIKDREVYSAAVGPGGQPEYWTVTDDNVTILSVDGTLSTRQASERISTRSLPAPVQRQGSVDKVVRNGSISLQNGGLKQQHLQQQLQLQQQQQQQQQQRPPQPPARHPNQQQPAAPPQPGEQPPSEDFAAAALGYEVQIKQKIAAQNRKRCCRTVVLICVLVVILCVAIALGLYYSGVTGPDTVKTGQN